MGQAKRKHPHCEKSEDRASAEPYLLVRHEFRIMEGTKVSIPHSGAVRFIGE